MATKQNDDQPSPGHEPETNRDPITGEPGAHPLGVTGGAIGAGAAGAAIGGAIGGPIGAVVGAVAGGISGGLAGHAVAEQLHPTSEHDYWRTEFRARGYAGADAAYDDYGPAYQYGWERAAQYHPSGRTFDQMEPELRRDWPACRGRSRLAWDQARHAAQDAWIRVGSAR